MLKGRVRSLTACREGLLSAVALPSSPWAGDGRLPREQAEEFYAAAQGCRSQQSHSAEFNQQLSSSCWCLHVVATLHHSDLCAQAAANARLQVAMELALTYCSSRRGTATSSAEALRSAANCMSFTEQGVAAAQCRCCAWHSMARCRSHGVRQLCDHDIPHLLMSEQTSKL